MVAVLEFDDGDVVEGDGADDEAAVVGEADVDDVVLLVVAGMTPPADAVPVVGVAQATVKKAVDRRAAAAMPWRMFTSDTFGFEPAPSGTTDGGRVRRSQCSAGPDVRRLGRTADKSRLIAVPDMDDQNETQITSDDSPDGSRLHRPQILLRRA